MDHKPTSRTYDEMVADRMARELTEDISEDLTPAERKEIDDSFERTRRLGHDAVLRALQAEANGGVAALIVNSNDDAPLCHINFPASYLTTTEDEERFMKVAARLAEKMREHDEAERRAFIAAENSGFGHDSQD